MPAPTQAVTRGPQTGMLEAIDFAVDELGIQSFAELDFDLTLGKHALYTIDKPAVQKGVLVDLRPSRARDQLLTVLEHAAERPGMRVVEGRAFDATTIDEVGEVDAILLFNLLLHTVAPDWDRVLELYAPSTSCFVIGNPQWAEGERTTRLIDLGRERFLETVPPSGPNRDLFDNLDEWIPSQQRARRDSLAAWQWGITDAELRARLDELGFGLDYEWSLGRFPGADGFVNKTFVFSRPEFSQAASRPRPRASPAVSSSPAMNTQAKENAELAELKRRLTGVERERDEWKARFEDVVHSSSWRLTEPLRALKRRFRR
jgi:hypothetical protein